MAFKYRGGDRTAEDARKAAKQAGSSYDSYLNADAQFMKVREGDATIRILPPTWDDKKAWGTGWHISIWIHRNVGPDNGTYLCLDKMKGEPCPVCQARLDATDEDTADALRLQNRLLCWAIDRDNEKDGPQVLSLPPTLFKDITNRSVRRSDGALLLLDGDKDGYGYDVFFTREGTDKKTKYAQVEIDREETPIADDQRTQDRWLDFIEDHPLPDLLQYYDADHIEKVLFGKSERRPRRDEGEDGGGRSRRRSGDDTPTERGSRDRRGRNDDPPPEEEEDRGHQRRRGRGEDAPPADDPPSDRRRSRGGDDNPADNDRSSRRRGQNDDPPADDPPADDPPRGERRRGRNDDPPDDPPRGERRRGRGGDDADPPPERGVERRRRGGDEGDAGGSSGRARERLGRLSERNRD